MLLEKTNFTENDIISIKLITSEELVAKLVESNDDYITITKPLVINIGMDQATNQMQLQMLPSFIFTGKPDAKLKISTLQIICVTLSDENAKSAYIKNTTSLAMPNTRAPGSGVR